jgi:hypothetical protein
VTLARAILREHHPGQLGPTGKIAKVRRYWANTDDGALPTAREMLRDDPTLIGFQLWDGSRSVADEHKRTGASPGGRSRQRPS